MSVDKMTFCFLDWSVKTCIQTIAIIFNLIFQWTGNYCNVQSCFLFSVESVQLNSANEISNSDDLLRVFTSLAPHARRPHWGSLRRRHGVFLTLWPLEGARAPEREPTHGPRERATWRIISAIWCCSASTITYAVMGGGGGVRGGWGAVREGICLTLHVAGGSLLQVVASFTTAEVSNVDISICKWVEEELLNVK